ncbi:MAG: tetratricopeptide repeat protein [Janthinobacterium lividum]
MRIFSHSRFPACVLLAALLSLAGTARAQKSSSSTDSPDQGPGPSSVVPRRGVEASGSAVTLETSESLFQVAAALNTCGYDNGLEASLPVRAAVRTEISTAVSRSPAAGISRESLCAYIHGHTLDGAQNLAQYVSLALFLTPPPELALSVPETEMPPDSLQVVGLLPLLRDFSEKIDLHSIYVHHRAGFEGAVTQVHDSITRMLLETNIYLHQPVSSYDGRRFLVLLEPMLSPQAVNARIYGNDYFIATSPAAIDPANPDRVSAGSRMSVSARASGLQMDRIRHLYLLYNIDPIIYARAGSTNRLLPLLKSVSDAPIDFTYKSDIVALTTECLIKAIEARTMDVGIPKPAKVVNGKQRTEMDGYNQSLVEYERKAEAVRRTQVVRDMESGWVLTESFYNKLALQDREGISLKENIGEMVYGMDVSHEVGQAKKIPFFKPDSPDLVSSGGVNRRRAPRLALTAMDQAELHLQKGDRMAAEDLAEKELRVNPVSGEALYVLARVKLMEGDPQAAYDRFTQVVSTSKDTRTVAWSHVYLGRLYDAQTGSNRPKAVAEYKAALNLPGIQPDVRAAAEAGIKQPFAPPKRTVRDSDQQPADDDEPLDPTGKKQKESYRPGEAAAPARTR